MSFGLFIIVDNIIVIVQLLHKLTAVQDAQCLTKKITNLEVPEVDTWCN